MSPPPAHADLRATEVASWPRSVFARSGRRATSEYRCVMIGTPADPMDDGWPSDIERTVAAWAPDERAALELCARGELVTVAFDAVARAGGFQERLTRLATPEISGRMMCLIHRRTVGQHRRTEALVEAIRAAARQP